MRQCAALAQIARRAGRDDVVPPRLAAARARDQMIERQVVLVAAVLAAEAVAQEHVEPREGRIKRRLHIGLERDDARQPHLERRAATKRSYSETMLTRSRNTAFTVSCQLQSDNG